MAGKQSEINRRLGRDRQPPEAMRAPIHCLQGLINQVGEDHAANPGITARHCRARTVACPIETLLLHGVIPTVTPAALPQLVRHQALEAKVSGDLYMPVKADGPVPALVLKHGSGGLQGPIGTNIRNWAATFTGWGIAAFVVDSFGPRGITSTGADQS
ncbi:MAG TPA: hypothetical protein VLJ17_11460, partial [Xanthobacteraceae bacterium]|nr:hypothetical protein [Xanthobacteraceae bacterium]